METFSHTSVLLEETLALLNLRPGAVVLDGTIGGAGHARQMLELTAPDGLLIGLDRDAEAIAEARRVLAPYGERARIIQANFSEAPIVLQREGVAALDAMLLDLGVSSWQLDSAERGFSFRFNAPLDMRMNRLQGRTAAEVVNEESSESLTHIFKTYGEERWARKIARKIEQVRQHKPIATTQELAELVQEAVPGGFVPARIHPATRVFQALRIFVNDELSHVERGVEQGIHLLKPGGVLAVISFHSLEDRIVKNLFRQAADPCDCPPRMPVCTCGKQPLVQILTRRGVRAGEREVQQNSRARSAVLRAVRRLPLPDGENDHA
ncbi:MAG: 16S rRNA (cytosine(1402)-N(4))-methyltransferase RsmH [Desulfuromonadaceae bacterium]|nr:16S rRNA (cytosine(1402)-N(4))-methyltransferase RsmH [Desulfuromonadaceae bacterium]